MITDTFAPSFNHSYTKPTDSLSFIKRFVNWCASRQEKRLVWASVTLSLHGCVLTPIAMVIAMLGGVEHNLFIPVIIAIAMNLVVNLAALPTKISIPVFFLSLLVDLGVIVAAFAYGLNFTALFS